MFKAEVIGEYEPGMKDDDDDQKQGSFFPNQRFNIDQSPMRFANDMKQTYLYEPGLDQNQEKVWISQPGCGFEKRQCTFQICFRFDREQLRTGIF